MSCTQSVTIQNHAGIHCRPSALIVSEVKQFSDVTLTLKSPQGNIELKSLLALISLGLRCGDTVTICAKGPHEKEACQRIAALFEQHFDFPPQQSL